jgi:hypothetical protein
VRSIGATNAGLRASMRRFSLVGALGRKKLIDREVPAADNLSMSTETRKPQTQEEADRQAVLEHAFKGAPLDPEVAKRVHERAAAVRAKLRLTDIAVDLIREIRNEE